MESLASLAHLEERGASVAELHTERVQRSRLVKMVNQLDSSCAAYPEGDMQCPDGQSAAFSAVEHDVAASFGAAAAE